MRRQVRGEEDRGDGADGAIDDRAKEAREIKPDATGRKVNEPVTLEMTGLEATFNILLYLTKYIKLLD